MALTYLEIVNSVLKRLREDEVTSITDTTYSALIAELVNTAKDEIEQAWKWNVLRDTVSVNTVAGTFRYILTGVGTQSILLDIWNDTEDSELRKRSQYDLNRLFQNSTDQSKPMYYGINGSDSNGDLQVDLYPIPDGIYNIDFNLVLKQADLSVDADTPLVPHNLIVLRAWALAVSERGEDGGMNFNEIDALYIQALSDAISVDNSNQHESEVDWVIV